MAGERLPVFYDEGSGRLVYRTQHGGVRPVFPAVEASVDGFSLTAAPDLTPPYEWTNVAGGGGATNHNALSGLSWVMSGHTGTAGKLAGFGGGGAATHYAIGTDVQAWSDELDAVDALASTGLAVRTGAGAWTTRTIVAGNDVVQITDGDGVAGNPTITIGGVVTIPTTTDAITSIALPDCEWVEIEMIGAGGKGQVGTTGDNSASRSGGRGGGSAARTWLRIRRAKLPNTLYYWLPSAGTSNTGLGKAAAVFFVDPGSFDATNPTATDHCYLVGYARGGAGGASAGTAGAGGAVATLPLALGLRIAEAYRVDAGQQGVAGGTTGTILASVPFGTSCATTPGCGGAGKSNVPAQAAGGGYAAAGPFAAVAGGAAGGGAGTAGVYGGGNATWTASSSDSEQLAWSYGGTGGGSNIAGQGGNGGAGAIGSGGGGGGAGTTGTSSGGDGGPGLVVFRFS